jgi:UDP-N-acetyl-2-amino-2-deoxyglucuronate dehydrogenase
MKHLGAAIVGLGKVSDAHALGYLGEDRTKLVGGFDNSVERRAKFSARYGCASFETLDALLANRDVHIVSVCSPHMLHSEHVVALLGAGKHVLVEKPMAVTVEECDRMMRTAAGAHRQLSVISQRRFYEPVRRVKQAIVEGRIGAPILGTVEVLGWRSAEYYALTDWSGSWQGEGGGVLMTQATHQLDILLWFLGPVDTVAGYWANFNHPTIEVEDTVAAVVRFRSGAFGNVLASNSLNPGLYGRVHVYGDLGFSIGVQTDTGSSFISGVTARVEPSFNDLWTIPGEADELLAWRRSDELLDAERDPLTYYHGLQIKDFVEAVCSERSPAVTALDGRDTVALIHSIYGAGRTGQAVTVAPRDIGEDMST